MDHHLFPQRFDLDEVHTAMNGSVIGTWLIAAVLGSMLTVQAASVTLAWDPPDPSTEVTGYKLYYGPAATSGGEWHRRWSMWAR